MNLLRSDVLSFVATITLAGVGGCSSLDPKVGPPSVEPPSSGDGGAEGDGETDEDVDPGAISFARDIRPLMDRPSSKVEPKGCKACHYRTESSHNGIDLGGLNLTTLGELRKGGGSSGTRIVVPGKPAESIIVQALKGQYAYAAQMPKGSTVYWRPEEIQLVADWIAQGAHGANTE